jgi:predicted YcjX-like family ATPase
MKIKITESDVLTLSNLKGKILLTSDTHRMYTIMRFKVEEASETIVHKHGFWKKTTTTTVEKQLYLTAADVNAWHSQGKFLGTLSDESAEWLLRRDLYDLRQNWIDFCDQLKAFGLQVVEIPETKQ